MAAKAEARKKRLEPAVKKTPNSSGYDDQWELSELMHTLNRVLRPILEKHNLQVVDRSAREDDCQRRAVMKQRMAVMNSAVVAATQSMVVTATQGMAVTMAVTMAVATAAISTTRRRLRTPVRALRRK